MNTSGTRLLGDADDGVLDLLRCSHHEVSELVHHTDDERIRAHLTLGAKRCGVLTGADLRVVVLDMAHARGLHVHVALLHLLHEPLQSSGCLLRLRDDRGDQVRDALVRGELHHLRVNQDEANLFRRRAGEQRNEHRVHKRGLTGTGRTCHEQVRHLLHRGRDKVTLNVLAQADEHRVMITTDVRGVEDIAQANHFTVGVGDLNTHGGLSGDRGEQADVIRCHGVRQVGLQVGDLGDLHAWAQLNLIAGYCRATREASHLGIHVEFFEDLRDRLDHAVIRLSARLRHLARDEKVGRREFVIRRRLGHASRGLFCVSPPLLRIRRCRRHGRSINPGASDDGLTHLLPRCGDSVGLGCGVNTLEHLGLVVCIVHDGRRHADLLAGGTLLLGFFGGRRLGTISVEKRGLLDWIVVHRRAATGTRATFCDGINVIVSTIVDILFLRVRSVGIARDGAEQRADVVEGFSHRNAGGQERAVHDNQDKQRHRNERREARAQRPANQRADRATRDTTVIPVRRSPRKHMNEAEHAHGDKREASAAVGTFGGRIPKTQHQCNRDTHEHHGQHQRTSTDDPGGTASDEGADRASNVQPHRSAENCGETDQNKSDRVRVEGAAWREVRVGLVVGVGFRNVVVLLNLFTAATAPPLATNGLKRTSKVARSITHATANSTHGGADPLIGGVGGSA